ncbi:MAG TPA: phosphatase PAP2 family protein [Burkholderiales bacterium]|nr:phosphatase PAP2 family protein [Burkholderiales bacterium]
MRPTNHLTFTTPVHRLLACLAMSAIDHLARFAPLILVALVVGGGLVVVLLWGRTKNLRYGWPVAGLAALFASIYVFIELADEVEADEDLHQFDLALAGAMDKTSPDFVLTAFQWITHLGDGWTITALGIAVGLALGYWRRWRLLWAWTIALAGSALLNELLKAVFERGRPPASTLTDSWSFPSGHAMNSLVAYGMLSYLLLRVAPPDWRPGIIAAAVAVVLLVGGSRLFLQAHYLSDVLAGYAAGMAWLIMMIAAAQRCSGGRAN